MSWFDKNLKKTHLLTCVSTQLSASRAPSGPHTTPFYWRLTTENMMPFYSISLVKFLYIWNS